VGKFFFLFLAIMFVLLNVLDGHSTFLVVSNAGLRSERNPIARFFFRKMGLKTGIVTLKSLSSLIIIIAYIFITDVRHELSIVLCFANAFYVLVVINNYRNYRKIEQNFKRMRKLEELAQKMKE
jgi:hypothetical protein